MTKPKPRKPTRKAETCLDCVKLVPSSFTAQDGEVWTCGTCGTTWVHVCEEAEGCWWENATLDPASKAALRQALKQTKERR